MPGEAPPDIYLRFSHDDDSLWDNDLVGESVDSGNPGWWYADAPERGWFMVTSFQFSISAEGAGGGSAGQGGAAKGSAQSGSGTASGKEVFKGFTVTLPLQLGCTYLMKSCAQWAQKHQKQGQDFEPIAKATFKVRRPGLSDTAEGGISGQGVFLYIVLSKVTVESYTMNSSCVAETFTLNYEDLQIQYLATNPESRQLALETDGSWNEANWSVSAKDGGDSA